MDRVGSPGADSDSDSTRMHSIASLEQFPQFENKLVWTFRFGKALLAWMEWDQAFDGLWRLDDQCEFQNRWRTAIQGQPNRQPRVPGSNIVDRPELGRLLDRDL